MTAIHRDDAAKTRLSNKKTEHARGSTFGGSAVSGLESHCFPPPLEKGLALSRTIHI